MILNILNSITVPESTTQGNYQSVWIIVPVVAILLLLIFRKMKKSRIAHEIELKKKAEIRASKSIKRN